MNRTHVKKVPVVDQSECTGCRLCLEVCHTGSLEVANGLAALVRPNDCVSDAHCVEACPEGAFRMVWVEMEGDRTRGKWGSGGRVWPGRLRGVRSGMSN
ncbi:MAG: 4Fe-4S binding protein [Verrucomicrobiales bacterium]|nr:4Fe-4S binding protein [Verrucomicrobiales bacterium]